MRRALLFGAMLWTAPAHAGDAKPLCAEATRACLVRTADAYFKAILEGHADAVPFAANVRVTEQDHVIATSRDTFLHEFKSTGATKGLRNMRMLVDEKAGEVMVLVLSDVQMKGQAPFTVRRAQRMRIVKGLITEVELVVYIDKSSPVALWPDARD